ncbi:T9SS type A sorting domain-containing protein [Fluviicola taffensis]|uniref:Secretion system C-terminal sorting domain-containing protein n=1 Tax=Fluviicola taffensis (strain DSM 16823 / NCIMB 13979 / RW262) TaxID=755732 RepID=F2IG51_FLUTR|nr:T9SS type A sorting domain-containing protein [Fluviicola taffensis]AEA44686.1 hypothetical protein Fluta_2705 [Fluviicola taffensis DSM 16823]
MKKILLSAAALISLSNVMAQGPVITDTVITGVGYANNIWYSLQNDETGTAVSSNWDIALASSASQNSPLTATILFNYKVGTLYAIPNATPANSFDTLATVNFGALTELKNNDSTWAEGALNRAAGPGQFDYGFGTYNMTTHNVDASRIFVVKYADNSVKKFYVNLLSVQGKYEIFSADLGNATTVTTQNLLLTPYGSKNFVYYKINTNTVVDREPASANWDFTFLQYPAAISPGSQYGSFGILNNVGVQAVKVSPVDPATYEDYQSQTFSNLTNAIGYNWKNAQAQPVATVPTDVVYFVKVANGNIWKVVFTKFTTGSGANSNMNVFTKQNLTTLSVGDEDASTFISVYPNPANTIATVVIDSKANTTVKVLSMAGQVVSENTTTSTGLQTINVSTENLNNGVYLVEVSNGAATTTQRLVVQH